VKANRDHSAQARAGAIRRRTSYLSNVAERARLGVATSPAFFVPAARRPLSVATGRVPGQVGELDRTERGGAS